MKKGKVVLAQPAVGSPLSRAPGPVRGGGEEAAYRASLRYRGDYRNLLKETQAKKSRLHQEKLKKQRLLAQVLAEEVQILVGKPVSDTCLQSEESSNAATCSCCLGD